MMNSRRYRAMGASIIVLAALSAVPAWAQDAAPAVGNPAEVAPAESEQIDEIVVTAQRREERIQDIPIAVTAIGGESLTNRGISTVDNLATIVPGLRISSGGGVTLPFLRGVGNQGATIGNEASVAVYIDGVYFSRLPAGGLSLNNLKRVEVLKGPQGTLFGRNSSGGVIQLVTLDPSHEPSVRGSLGYGNYNTFEGNVYATTGLSDTLAIDLSVSGRRQSHGYGRNVATGNRTHYLDNFAARSKVLFEPTDLTTFNLAGFYNYSKNNIQGNTYPGTLTGFQSLPNTAPLPPIGFYDQRSDEDAHIRASTWGGSLTADHEASFANLKSITAYMDTNQFSLADTDFTPRSDGRATPSGHIRQFTQELQASSLSGSALQWVFGLYYYDTVSTYDERTLFNSPSGALASLGGTTGFISLGRQHSKSYAGYGQATYEILPRLKVTGGLRYTIDRIDASGGLFRPTGAVFGPVRPAGEANDERLTFRAAVDYKFNDDVLGYVSFNRGYKSAVFNLLTYNEVPNKPEVVDAYEIGLKGDLFDRRVRFSAAAFHYDIKNPQVQTTRAPTILFSNAGASEVDGVEADVQVKVARGFTLRAGGAYIDSRFTDFGRLDATGKCIPGTCAPTAIPRFVAPFGSFSPQSELVANGNQTPYVSKFTLNLGAEYEFDTSLGTFLFTADYAHNSRFFSEADNFLTQPATDLINAAVKLSLNENLGVRVWGRNLLDEKYFSRINSNTGPAGYTFTAADPFTYGAAIDFKF